MDKKPKSTKVEKLDLPDAEKAKAKAAMKAFVEKATVLKPQAVVKKGVVKVRSLRIRKDHTTNSEMVGGLVEGNEVTIYETFVDGDDTWARIGEDQWAAMIYNGENYIEVE